MYALTKFNGSGTRENLRFGPPFTADSGGGYLSKSVTFAASQVIRLLLGVFLTEIRRYANRSKVGASQCRPSSQTGEESSKSL